MHGALVFLPRCHHLTKKTQAGNSSGSGCLWRSAVDGYILPYFSRVQLPPSFPSSLPPSLPSSCPPSLLPSLPHSPSFSLKRGGVPFLPLSHIPIPFPPCLSSPFSFSLSLALSPFLYNTSEISNLSPPRLSTFGGSSYSIMKGRGVSLPLLVTPYLTIFPLHADYMLRAQSETSEIN